MDRSGYLASRCVARGLMRGFVGVLASVAAWLLATWAAFRFGARRCTGIRRRPRPPVASAIARGLRPELPRRARVRRPGRLAAAPAGALGRAVGRGPRARRCAGLGSRQLGRLHAGAADGFHRRCRARRRMAASRMSSPYCCRARNGCAAGCRAWAAARVDFGGDHVSAPHSSRIPATAPAATVRPGA